MNPNSILFLYEGDTERAFYQRVFERYLTDRTIRIFKQNLKGINSSLNFKVLDRIISHLQNHPELTNIHVFVAFDREGPRDVESALSTSTIRSELKSKGKRVMTINEIIATQDIESWFYYDINSIFDFLQMHGGSRNVKKYSNPESLNNTHLSKLFRENGRSYIKGKDSELIPNLNVGIIYKSCNDLRIPIKRMIFLAKSRRIVLDFK